MTRLADLHRAVQATIGSKRLGKTVFVRYLVQGLQQGEAVVHRLALAAAAVREWLGQPLDRVYAVGKAEGGQVSLALQFRAGASALVSYVRGQPRGAGVDLIVLGNHGVIYHDAGAAQLWDEWADPPGERPEPAILAVIERALETGKPEIFRPEAAP